ncbi:hypothetical protein V8C26DRAFT_222180 [Trichoderma gracile]
MKKSESQKNAKKRVCHLSGPPVQSPPTIPPIRQLAKGKKTSTRLPPSFHPIFLCCCCSFCFHDVYLVALFLPRTTFQPF